MLSHTIDDSLKCDTDYIVDNFCEEWVLQLNRDDKVSLGLFLAFQLHKHLSIGATKAAELAAIMTGKSMLIGESTS